MKKGYGMRAEQDPRHCSARQRPLWQTLAVALIAAAAAACSSVPPPNDQLARARSAVDQAAAAGAVDGAPAELAAARDKYARAEQAVQAKDNVLARELAEESEADAQLAISRAQVSKSRRALSEVQESTRVMQQEIDRAQSR